MMRIIGARRCDFWMIRGSDNQFFTRFFRSVRDLVPSCDDEIPDERSQSSRKFFTVLLLAVSRYVFPELPLKQSLRKPARLLILRVVVELYIRAS